MDVYHINRNMNVVDFDLPDEPSVFYIYTESLRLTEIMRGEPVTTNTAETYVIEKEAIAVGYSNTTAQAVWNMVTGALVQVRQYPGEIREHVGWVKGTQQDGDKWGAFLWLAQNRIAFKSSETNWWKYTNGVPVAISNVLVGTLGDYPPLANIVDIGPTNSGAISFPGAGESEDRHYRVDITNVFYELIIPSIWITPRDAYACVGGSNVEFTVVGTNIPSGVTWSLSPTNFEGHADFSSTTGSNAWVAPGSVATNYKVRATSVDNTNFYDEVSLMVFQVELEKCASAFLPKGGSEDNTTTIRAFVTPDIVKGKFRFTLLDVSDEKGYCLNAPTNVPASGEDSDTWKDFQFQDPQTGFTVSGSSKDVAETTANTLSDATVTIKSFDYGSFGKIKAEFTTQDGTLTCVSKEVGGTNEYTRLPADTNGNCIADSWSGDTGPGTSKEASDELDNMPAGDGTDGDQLSRYQEYRGFIVQGTHVRTDPTQKDVFCRNHNVDQAGPSGFLTTENLGAPVHAISDNEWTSTSRRINQMSESYTLSPDLQTAIKVVNHAYDGGWGVAYCEGEHWVPNNLSYCWVDVTNMQGSGTTLYGSVGSTNTVIMVWTPGTYRDSGAIKIDDEIILYSSITSMAFAGCTRGAMGTTAASHTNNANVANFANVNEAIQAVFGHEAGHVMELGHTNNSIMNSSMPPGSYMNNGYWSTYAPALTNKFRVKP